MASTTGSPSSTTRATATATTMAAATTSTSTTAATNTTTTTTTMMMMQSMDEAEQLIQQFFEAPLPAERKKQIETMLTNFRNHPTSWQQCTFWLKETHTPYVQWLSLWVLEDMVAKSWLRLPPATRSEIQTLLMGFLRSNHKSLSYIVFQKLVKVIVDIAKFDWPHGFPELMPVIQQMAASSDMNSVGLTLLHAVNEGFIAPGDDISDSRRKELKKMLTEQVPGMLSLVQHILETIFERDMVLPLSTQGPRPSPVNYSSRSPSPSSVKARETMFGMSYGQPGMMGDEKFLAGGRLDAASKKTCQLALEVLYQMFGWISLSDHVNASMIGTLFKYAALYEENTVSMGVTAMSCIIEIMSRPCVPREFEEYLISIFVQTFNILKELTDDSTDKAGVSLEDLDENYREKFTDFLHLFLSQHIRRVEGSLNFPLLDFLGQLYKYTFMQPSTESFLRCVDIWDVFLDYLILESKNDASGAHCQRYKGAMEVLLPELLKRLQFKTNGQDLNEINDEAVDADNQTEWDHFLNACVNVIGKISELFPKLILDRVHPLLLRESDIFFQANDFLQSANVATDSQRAVMFCCLKDERSLLRIFGRLSDLYVTHFDDTFSSAQPLLEHFLSIGNYMCRCHLARQGPLLFKISLQLLATLQSFTHWLRDFNLRSSSLPEQRLAFNALIANIVQLVIDFSQTEGPVDASLIEVSCECLLSITKTVRPANIFEVAKFREFVQNLNTSVVTPSVRELQFHAIASAFLVPFAGISDDLQGLEARSQQFLEFSRAFLKPYVKTIEYPLFVENKIYRHREVRERVMDSLHACRGMLAMAQNESKSAKVVVHEALKDALPVTLSLFAVYIDDHEMTSEIVDFFLALYRSLRVQLGMSFTSEMISSFLTLFGGDQIANILRSSHVVGLEVMHKFILLLTCLIDEPTKTFETFLPDIIGICLNQLFPKIESIDSSASAQVRPDFFSLVYSILVGHWKFFFPVSSPAAQLQTPMTQNVLYFTNFLQMFAWSFKQPDIETYRHNVKILEDLNKTKRLFKQELFKLSMWSGFLEIFLRTLLHRTHDLLQEEITAVVYDLASVDFHSFYGQFLHSFIEHLPSLTAEQRASLRADLESPTDLPTFVSNVRRFTLNYVYFQRINSAALSTNGAGSILLL